MRIAIIASCRHPIREPFAGGLEAHVWHLCGELTTRGHQVSLFAAPGSDRTIASDELRFSAAFEPSATAAADVSMPGRDFLADHHAYLRLMVSLSAHPARFDVIHNHSLHYLPVAMASAVTTPMLSTLHTPPTPWLESAYAVSGPDAVRCVAVSQYTARSWRKVISDVRTVPNGVNLERWTPGPGGDRLVWFGRITPEKAPHLAIAAARLAGRDLVLAGPISDPAYFASAIEPELDQTVTYAGHLGQADLAALVGHSAVCLVTPEWDEPYGLVVAEAMACGTPVVAFERGGIPEVIADVGGVIVPPSDVAAMAVAVPRAAAMDRRTVRAHASRHCSVSAMVTSYLRIYHSIVGATA